MVLDLPVRVIRNSGFLAEEISFGYGFFVGVVQDPIAAKVRVSAGSFGGGGTFGTFAQIDPRENLVMILMIQSAPANDALQRDFENAVMQSIIR